MQDKHIRRLAFAGMMAVVVALATLVVRVASPMGGYINLGDCFVLLSGFLLGPVWGAAAAGLGAALADLLSGCAYFAPGTLVIKALMAVIAWAVRKALSGRTSNRTFAGASGRAKAGKRGIWPLLAGSFCAELFMVAGYFGYSALILGRGSAALLSVPGNLLQGGAAVTLGVLLMLVLEKIPDFRKEEKGD